jgi:hypothetical protein
MVPLLALAAASVALGMSLQVVFVNPHTETSHS